jgi:hypothetical protein
MVDHWPAFTDFVRAELATGGPDPQVGILAHLAKPLDQTEKLWLAGCYCSVHCIPSAHITWQHFRPNDAYFDSSGLEKWLIDHWKGLPVRPEMRSHRMPHKRAKCLKDFAEYALSWTPAKRVLTYNELWEDSISNVKFFGRYMAIKYLEILNRMEVINATMPDMRAKGSWSPRMALSMLHPDAPYLAERGNESKAALLAVDEWAQVTIWELEKRGITVSMFQLQVLLCEYKESLVGGYAPGASHKEEDEYIRQALTVFPHDALETVFDARKELFGI